MTSTFGVLAWNELRLRLRRTSTLVVFLAVVAITWGMIPDPKSGMALISVKGARVLYSSSAMAFGSATLASLFLGLASFYLTRGRIAEDLRSGIGSVIAATQVSNRLFLFARCCGGALYMLALVLALLGTTLILHALRGEGPMQLGVYLLTFAMILTPVLLLGVSCALLFDSIAMLMGKAGDVLFFFLWIAQLAVVGAIGSAATSLQSPLIWFDFSGLAMGMIQLKTMLGTGDISVGVSQFNSSLALLRLPDQLWSLSLVGRRLGTSVLALAPMLPAIWFFHRYSPDRVKATQTRARRSLLAVLNDWLRPLARLVQPLFSIAARTPGIVGQVIAETALTLVAAPAAILAILLILPTALLVDDSALPGVLIAASAFWGILISSISTRDFECNLEDMSNAALGGVRQRVLRHWLAASALGLMLCGPIAAQWLAQASTRVGVLLSGVFALSACATCLGHITRTARTFLALFLFGLYVSLNARELPMLDVLGFNGVATLGTALTQIVIAAVAMALCLQAPRLKNG